MPYGARNTFKRGAHTRITRRHDGVISGHIFTLLRRLVNIPGHCKLVLGTVSLVLGTVSLVLGTTVLFF